jgi:swainsonine biosynthesis oxidoreductase SwnR
MRRISPTGVCKSNKGDFFDQRNIHVHRSDYSIDSVLHILNVTNASAFISFNNSPDQTFVTLHCNFLEACRRSINCKRFIPSEFAGNIDDFPLYPSYFTASRVPFREVLAQEKDVEWTIFNNGWLMDYFLTEEKSYMPAIPKEFPVDPNNWKACIRDTGDQEQSFTSARDVAKALIMLLGSQEWASCPLMQRRSGRAKF